MRSIFCAQASGGEKGGGGLATTVSLAAGQGNPVNAGPINFTVAFSKPVTGFTNADVSFAGSTVGGTLAAAVTGTGPAYNVAVTGMTGNGWCRSVFLRGRRPMPSPERLHRHRRPPPM